MLDKKATSLFSEKDFNSLPEEERKSGLKQLLLQAVESKELQYYFIHIFNEEIKNNRIILEVAEDLYKDNRQQSSIPENSMLDILRQETLLAAIYIENFGLIDAICSRYNPLNIKCANLGILNRSIVYIAMIEDRSPDKKILKCFLKNIHQTKDYDENTRILLGVINLISEEKTIINLKPLISVVKSLVLQGKAKIDPELNQSVERFFSSIDTDIYIKSIDYK